MLEAEVLKRLEHLCTTVVEPSVWRQICYVLACAC